MKESLEQIAQRYFDALQRITCYQSTLQLRREAGKQYGLQYHEALEMAYENIIDDAKRALGRRRRP